jgi:DNA-binding MarR family transcriptional regulator
MLRDEADLELLAELAAVLDQTVSEAGLSAGGYLVLRELVRTDEPQPVTGLATALSADPNEVAELCGRLVEAGLVETRPNGVVAGALGRETAERVDAEANEAIRAYVMERPHTATVYGLVASMQAGRFTVEDLVAFVREAPGETGEEGDADD